ncbi:dihydroxyacetone kinase phosphoryl donor subunit DhaM [Cellulomonas sp. PhB143]|uniref:dihydroxyacetone kinase phosphoryl donor subunit DhaM n=1 Tax=Cellulomonas sp. PhB143 TaxID=2485186 RepID=UPI000F47DBA6|nr:dihydroxyacetone kinase phosphoryl donor subunit DhaM [Cellulomonas sp. PhB143]ROS77100.1 PTS hybrid protein [Cellulomonas sp. PhB143]
MSATAPAPRAVARVRLVLVSHSASVAEGVCELAAQMAPGVRLVPAGGTEDGGIGTGYERVEDALRAALDDADATAVVLTDLGSAVMTVEAVLEAEPELAERSRLVSAPFLEGAVAAAVTAHGGGDLDVVARSAEHAGTMFGAAGDGDTAPVPETAVGSGRDAGAGTGAVRTVVVPNPTGLHARPAAVLARMVAGLGVAVTIDGVNGASVLEIMKLGAGQGSTVEVRASGTGAAEAVDAVVGAIEGGLGDL